MNVILAPSIEMLPMNVGDIDEVLAIENAIYPFPWTNGNFSDSLRAGYSAWVCRIGSKLIGYSIVMLILDEAHLLNISVDGKYHGNGYGAHLLRHSMSVAHALGARSILLEVRPSNARALDLYRLFGFVRIGVRKGYYPAHGGREDALVLTRGLGETQA